MSEPGRVAEVLGRRVAENRRRSKKSRRELARSLGKTSEWVVDLEAGRLRVTVNDLCVIASALAVSPRKLLPTAEELIVTCEECGDVLARRKLGAGRPRRFCSRECQNRSYFRQWHENGGRERLKEKRRGRREEKRLAAKS